MITHDLMIRNLDRQKLTESETFNTTILSSLSSQIAVINDEGLILYINKAWEDFGKNNGGVYPAKDAKNSNYFAVCKIAMIAGDLIAGEALDGILSVFKKEKTVFELEYPCNTPYQQRWFMLSVMQFGNDDRKVVISHNEITGRKKAEDALRESESNLQAIFENTSEGFILVDLNGIIKTFNNKSREIFFLNTGKNFNIGDSIFDFVRDSTKEIYKAAIPKMLSGEHIQYDLSFERQNGETKWFTFNIDRVYSGGSINGFSISARDITKTIEIQSTLQQSELRYRQIVETAQEGIWMIDQDNKTSFVNQKMCEIVGYTKEEMQGKPNYFLSTEHGKQIALEQLERRKLGVNEIHEAEYITKSGKHIWVNISTNAVFNEHGKYNGALAMVADITEKKMAEDLLDRTNTLARIGNWEFHLATNILYWSEITKDIHEVSHDFIPNLETAINFYKAGANRDAMVRSFQVATEKGIGYDLELEVVTARGNERWVRAIGKADFENGKCIKMYGSFQDIDKRKKSEIAFVEIYKEKNQILESIGDGFYAVDKNWNITYWNNKAEILLNKKREDVLGRSIWEIYPEAVNTDSYFNYHKAIQENTVQHYQRFNEELQRWIDITVYPSANGLSIYFKDITQQVKGERERAEIAADLIQRNKDLEQFSYILSHNLRAPVANIIGLSNMLQEEDLPDEMKKTVISGVYSSVNKLDVVINDLNDILKVRRALNENKQVVNIGQLVDDICLSIDSIIAKEKAVFLCDFSEMAELLTIKSYLYSILYNLISNSLKYRQPNVSPVIAIRTKKIGNKIILFFKDNGMGIDLQKKGDQVFGLYKRFHTAQAEGKGMGLYMVKTQVEAIGGKIKISSDVNIGTEFQIELNINQSE